jgi:capsular polysaccharide biosynthesis protein
MLRFYVSSSANITSLICDGKLYLSRLGYDRSLANGVRLESYIDKLGFVGFDGPGVSLLSQIALFSSARQLIGLHGAALANIVWAGGVNVCEIFSSAHMPGCYSALTAIRLSRYTSGLLLSGS